LVIVGDGRSDNVPALKKQPMDIRLMWENMFAKFLCTGRDPEILRKLFILPYAVSNLIIDSQIPSKRLPCYEFHW
jgi:hypothetical protein